MGCARKGAEKSVDCIVFLCIIYIRFYVYSSLKSVEHYHYVRNYYTTVKKTHTQHYFIDSEMETDSFVTKC
jgi:hypothetical protein